MPSSSGKQHRLMAMVANNPKAAKRVGIPQSVGEEFMEADKGRKFGSGGTRADQMSINKPKTNHGGSALFSKGGEMKEDSAAYKAKEKKHVEAMKKAGVPKKIIKEEAVEAGMKMARGGKTKMMASGGYVRAADGVAKKGKTRAMQVKMAGNKGMKRGGMC